MQLNTLGIVHDFLQRNIHKGDFCIDATAGKGRDTVLLCRLAGEEGKVLAMDIQEEAVRQTKELLQKEGLKAEVVLDGHENMERYAQPETVDAVVFNFGRLPGGDVNIFTHGETSIAAIDAALRLLKPGGFISIALYYGGYNGMEEKDAVLAHLASLDDRRYSVLKGEWFNRPNDPPMPIVVWKA